MSIHFVQFFGEVLTEPMLNATNNSTNNVDSLQVEDSKNWEKQKKLTRLKKGQISLKSEVKVTRNANVSEKSLKSWKVGSMYQNIP